MENKYNKIIDKVNSMEDIEAAKKLKLKYRIISIITFVFSIILMLTFCLGIFEGINTILFVYIFIVGIILCGLSLGYFIATTKMLPNEKK